MRAAIAVVLAPLILASVANCCFQASKPVAVLPHCAASAVLAIPTSDAKATNAMILDCRATNIRTSFHTEIRCDDWLSRPSHCALSGGGEAASRTKAEVR